MNLRGGLARVGRADALLLSATLWFVAKFLRYAFPPLFPTFRASFGVSNTVLGAAFTAMMLVYAVMQFPSGALADRIGATKVVAGGALLTAAAALAIGVVPAFPVIVVGMVLVGLGTGVHKTVSMGLLAAVYPDRTGRALGAMDTLGALGGAGASAAIVAVLASPYGWPTAFLAAGATGVLLAALFLRRIPRREPDPDPDAGASLGAYGALYADRRLAAFVCITLLFSFAYNGAVAFFPSYLTAAGGLSEATAGGLFSALFLASLVQTLTGEAADRVGTLPTLVAALSLAAVGIVALVALGEASPLALGAAVVAFGLGGHGHRPVRGAYLMAELPEEAAGGGLGAVRTLLMGAGALSPAVVGAVSDIAGFRVAFGLLAVAVTGAAAITLGLLVTR